jgi:hypothetical protein
VQHASSTRGHFIGAPSQGGGRPASNYACHQGIRFPNGDYRFHFMIQTQNQSCYLGSNGGRSAGAKRCGTGIVGHGKTWHGHGHVVAWPGTVGPHGRLGKGEGPGGVG